MDEVEKRVKAINIDIEFAPHQYKFDKKQNSKNYQVSILPQNIFFWRMGSSIISVVTV